KSQLLSPLTHAFLAVNSRSDEPASVDATSVVAPGEGMAPQKGPGGGDMRSGRTGTYWSGVICALLFFAATINYIDRQVIGILKPTLVKEFGWSDERTYAAIVFSFQLAYAIGLLLAGRVMDKLGVRLGFVLAVTLWSVAALAHAVAGWFPSLRLPTLNLDASTGLSVVSLGGAAAGFALVRFLLGLGEAGNF